MRQLLRLCLALASPLAFAAPQATPVEWELDGTTFSGYLVFEPGSEQRPGLLMLPNWMGVTDAAVTTAKKLAGDDYVVLVADLYGKGVRPADPTEARTQVMDAYSEPARLRARAAKALDVLHANGQNAPLQVDKLGAVGFCFGGGVALELARSGAELDVVASFHGDLTGTSPAAKNFKPSVLILNGADDGNVKSEDIAGFQKEMDAIDADWQFVNFSGAVHCFSEPEANRPPGCVYNARAATRAFRMANEFFEERLGD